METANNHIGFVPQACSGFAQFVAQLSEIMTTEVLHLDMFEVMTDALNPDRDPTERTRELGLDPYDPDKIQAARRAIHAELRELAAELSQVDELR